MEYRFFIRDGNLQATAFEQVTRDSEMARMSKAFRVYYRLRPLIPLWVRHFLQQRRSVIVPDNWYLPKDFVTSLVRCIEQLSEPLQIVHPWPEGAHFAFVLTHDVETEAGMRNIPALTDIEEELGFRSALFIVPHKYDVDVDLIQDLKNRSFEIGIHGYNHDGRLYLAKQTFDERTAPINAAIRNFGAVGFRSPMVHRNLEWLQNLDIEYDASCFDVDPYQPMPGGVGSLWPFLAGKFVELPYTLPQDHTLFVALREEDGRIWEDKVDFIIRNRGMALMVTHPDYMTTPKYLDVYRRFLAAIRDKGGYWHALPKEVAAWWRIREESAVQRSSDDGRLRVVGPACDRGSAATVEARDGCLVIDRLDATSADPPPVSVL